MPYNTKNILLDAGNKPIAQIYNAAADAYRPLSAGVSASDTITRPANTTAYAINDVVSTEVGEILEFASVGAASDLICVLGCTMTIYDSVGGNVPDGCAGYRLHLYNASPTAIADNSAYNLPSGDRAKYLGYIDLGIPIDLGATVATVNDNINHVVKLAGTSLYGILQVKGAETPDSGAVYTIILTAVGM